MYKATQNIIRYLSVIIICTGLSGCMVGPDYSRPQTAAQTDAGYFRLDKHKEDINDVIYNRWWERFCDPCTNQLVTEMLENNYDLKAAAARLLQAKAAFTEVSGRRLPEISYNFARSRSKTSFNFGGAGRFSNLSSTFSQNISVSYVLDIFGRLKRAERAAWADVLAVEWNQRALIHSMIAGVIKARIDITTISRNLDIARANTRSRQSTLNIVERRYGRGLVGPVDVRLARANLEASKAAEANLELSLIRAYHTLDIFIGVRPGLTGEFEENLPDLPDLTPIPIGLPASLLDRRPDVMAAEMNLKAANEQIGVSVAQLFPDLTLTGALGRNADRWRDIWLHETEIYSTVFRLSQPIFKGGQLRAQVDRSKGRFAELAADYAGIVLTALKEVEDALAAEQMLMVQLEHTQLQFAESQAAEKLSRQRYQRGLESLLTVLESERRRRNAEVALALLKGQIWTTRVNLFLAIGGDWVTIQDK